MHQLLRFRDLEYFVAVAERRSFAKAAEALGVSQPTLSNQMRRIEGSLGCRVFDRAGRAVTLTPEGERILPIAREALRCAYDLDRARRAGDDFVGRTLRFGVIATVATYLGPPLVKRLAAENRTGSVSFVEAVTGVLEARVASGELDFAVTATPPQEATLQARPFAAERIVYLSAVPPVGDPLSERGEARRPILLMQEGHCLRDFAYEALARANAQMVDKVNYAVAPASLSTLCELVRHDLGDALAPAPLVAALPQLTQGLSVTPLEARRFERSLHLIVRAGRADTREMKRLRAIAAETHAALSPSPDAPAPRTSPVSKGRARAKPVERARAEGGADE